MQMEMFGDHFKKLPTLYKKDSKGKIRQWRIWVEDNIIFTEHGVYGGKMQLDEEVIINGKNIGRANETTPAQQAYNQAKSSWEKKNKKDYHISLDSALTEECKMSSEGGFIPMLAHRYDKFPHKINFPCYAQPKLDGCIFRTTKINTIDGEKTIEDIVENKINTKVLSYNLNTYELEYKQITNWFNNGKSSYNNWLEIVPEYGKHIKCTKNHNVYTNNGWKRADELDVNTDYIYTQKNSILKNSLLDQELSFQKFKVRSSKNMPIATKYDIEVEDNHNYIANNILIHNCRGVSISFNKTNDNTKLFTRTGKELTTMNHITKELNDVMLDGEIWDGELYDHDGIFEEFTGAIRRKEESDVIINVKYHIYDFPRIGDLTENDPYSKRLALFQERMLSYNGNHLAQVHTQIINNEEQITEFFRDAIFNKYEGIMLRNINSPYVQKRSYDLLKVKKFIDDEFEIVGVNEGKGRLVGHAGSFTCICDSGKFDVKLKGKIGDLKKYYQDQESVIGKMLTVQFFEYTNDGKPRFPVGLRIRESKDF